MSVELWACEAYGPVGLDFGALCFFAGPHQRECASLVQCSTMLDIERRRLFLQLSWQAEQGDDVAIEILRDIHCPEQLLGGRHSDPDDDGR